MKTSLREYSIHRFSGLHCWCDKSHNNSIFAVGGTVSDMRKHKVISDEASEKIKFKFCVKFAEDQEHVFPVENWYKMRLLVNNIKTVIDKEEV